MKRYVAFLRAINTGSRRAKNHQLSEVLEQVGAVNATGFLASGNVVFDVDGELADHRGNDFVERVENAYVASLGLDVPVMLRSAEQVRTIAGCKPFSAHEAANSGGRLYVGLLKDRPSEDQVARVLAMATVRGRVAVIGEELYWLPESDEYLSGLSIPAVERIIGPLTVRAQSTITRLADKYL